VLVWVIPLVGAIFVLGVWAHDRKSTSRDPVRYGEGPWLPGIGPENEHRHHGNNLGDSGSHDGHGGDTGGAGLSTTSLRHHSAARQRSFTIDRNGSTASIGPEAYSLGDFHNFRVRR
jgi:hypothetical protein